jgi:uncharacterized protein (DUF2147 family)
MARPMLAIAILMLAAAPPGLAGNWVTQNRSAIVHIGDCDGTICGRIVRVLDRAAPPNDVNNPDPARRRRPLVGLAVLSGFTLAGNGAAGGRAYDPETGRSYRSYLGLNGDGTLRVTGCIAFFCRSQTWTRAR